MHTECVCALVADTSNLVAQLLACQFMYVEYEHVKSTIYTAVIRMSVRVIIHAYDSSYTQLIGQN